MSDTDLPAELEPVLDDLVRTAQAEPLFAGLPPLQLTTEMRAALAANADPLVGMLDAEARANTARDAALRDLVDGGPSEQAAAAVSRAAMQAEGARLGIAELKRRVLARARWGRSEEVLARRRHAGDHAARIVGANGLAALQRDAAKALDQALDALAAAAEGYRQVHEETRSAALDCARLAIQQFEAPYPSWALDRRMEVRDAFDLPMHVVAEGVLNRLDAAFRPWGSAWTQNAQLRYVQGSDSIEDSQAKHGERACRSLLAMGARYGVEVPEDA